MLVAQYEKGGTSTVPWPWFLIGHGSSDRRESSTNELRNVVRILVTFLYKTGYVGLSNGIVDKATLGGHLNGRM